MTQVLVEAEEDAGSAQGTFDGIQPDLADFDKKTPA
jgi:hypothetical protein